jgi:hypothetical protein
MRSTIKASINSKVPTMNVDLKEFVMTYLRVVAMALMPLAVTAFLTMPYILGGHPGEPLTRADQTELHMS